MAQIYGQSGAENNVIQRCPPEVRSFNDIKPFYIKYKNQLEKDREIFFNNLPDLIQQEKMNIEELNQEKVKVEEDWDLKIDSLRESFERNKLMFWKYLNMLFWKYISKPRAIKQVEKKIILKEKYVNELVNEPEHVFAEENQGLIKKINHLEEIIHSDDYSGAYGEIKVLNELKELDDAYHVFCDKKLRLRDYVRYKGTRNLRSAQMDFIVVGPTGIFVIEVKNWSSKHINNHRGISPHEQVDRAGKVLWIYLKQRSYFYKPMITKLLVPIQNNIQYNPYFKSVLIRNPYNVKKFIYGNRNSITEKRVNKVVSVLR